MLGALVGLGVGCGSGGAGEDGATPSQASRADPRPVTEDYDPRRTVDTVVGGPGLGGSVTFARGTLDFPAQVVLDRDPPVEGPPPPIMPDPKLTVSTVAEHFNVDARRSGAAKTGGDWDPPLELVIDLPASAASIPAKELIACFYTTAGAEQGWKAIPLIRPGAQLAPGARDGFYLTGSGAKRQVHIRSRHLTLFSVFRAHRREG